MGNIIRQLSSGFLSARAPCSNDHSPPRARPRRNNTDKNEQLEVALGSSVWHLPRCKACPFSARGGRLAQAAISRLQMCTKPRRPMIDASCTTNQPSAPTTRARTTRACIRMSMVTRTRARITCTLSKPESMAVSFMLARPTPRVADIAGFVSDRTTEAALEICASRQQCEFVTRRSCSFLLGVVAIA